ncbi:MAG: hypothetical protein O9272_10345 [Brevundimonas sp.]|nr:hypothetical protein [Brevundimonas sp.]
MAGQVSRVDDSGTLVLEPVLQMQWQASRSSGSTLASASTRISVQLNLAPWLGRKGQIYMALPSTSGPGVRARWQTGGTLFPGTLVSGGRALVFSGPITAPVLRDLVEIKLEVDGSRLAQPEALSFGFEIEVEE